MNIQTPPGVTLAEIFPDVLPILDHLMIGAAVFMLVGVIYLFIQWMIAHSRMEDIDSDTLPFDMGFIAAISLPLILLNIMASMTGLILGAVIGAILALATYFLLRRYRATHKRATH
ncbi:hypothetical protein SAMN04487917_11396 [Arthrobacter sp. yr096]|uniref:hypothetical protein n=1 Tax=Arthrobacter sp. yr096 TaxID=1761750 RepID=UPI0008CAA748|nr:hypothetical protein [Arthrobacter sp. yr096]SEJ78722.1 hypothetical protein SAMN04487917_11396 [Arthrobacter sp. yr096]